MGCDRNSFYLPIYSTEKTDLHGLPGVFGDGGIVRKLIWIIVTIAAWVIVIYETVLLLISFFQYLHVTKVDIVYKQSVDFPAVTVCNFNKYRESAFTDEDIVNVGFYLGILDEDHNLITPGLYTDEFAAKVKAINWTAIPVDPEYNMTDFVYRTGYQKDSFIVQCMWREEECKEDDLVHVFTHLGNCYTFNSYSKDTDRKVSYMAGSSNGLRLILNVEVEDYTPTNDLLGGDAMDVGVKIMLHPPTEPPYVKELGFVASVNQHTYVAMRHSQISTLPHPYTECQTEDTAGFYRNYSLQGCRIECETKAVEKYCNCRLVEQPSIDGVPVCNPNQTHVCAESILLQVTESKLPDDVCKCRSPCEVEDFPFSTTSAKLRADFMERLFRGTTYNFTTDYIEDNVAVLSVFYQALNYEVVDQIPAISFVVLLANIGGNLGLFTGASVLTAFQIVEYFYDEGSFQYKRVKKNKNKVRNSSASRLAMSSTEAPMRMGGDVHSIMDYDTPNIVR
ncbi:acid-sensing ion channel 2-like [Anneissia japonica]|uniref:acid-sensing ion channel 2-like n=1 Tax=Anneissia japonica TaxID=1529436 RepID=UPI0014255625|nr:acid-sensing ion channel 2-like [Anneissia japonica]XP_033124242.1 acid-sensing ion channel 2-like [Anneissia japonica]XP_033124243.1 acid-sensing ion channel 2-like [Anneissia japonica]